MRQDPIYHKCGECGQDTKKMLQPELYFCDECGKDFNEGISVVWIEKNRTKRFDFCTLKCAESLVKKVRSL